MPYVIGLILWLFVNVAKLGFAQEPVLKHCEGNEAEIGYWGVVRYPPNEQSILLLLSHSLDISDQSAWICYVGNNQQLMPLPNHKAQPIADPMARFHDGISCIVQGYLYVMPREAPSFTRMDTCSGVRSRLDQSDHVLLLWSPHMMVTIPLPERTDGQRIFQYLWGAESALIGGQPQHVHVEPAVRG